MNVPLWLVALMLVGSVYGSAVAARDLWREFLPRRPAAPMVLAPYRTAAVVGARPRLPWWRVLGIALAFLVAGAVGTAALLLSLAVVASAVSRRGL